jgi:hypothetical protein
MRVQLPHNGAEKTAGIIYRRSGDWMIVHGEVEGVWKEAAIACFGIRVEWDS